MSSFDKRCFIVGVLMTGVTLAMSFFWYMNQKGEFMRWVYRIGLNRASATLCLVWLGLLFFFVLVWLFYRRAPWQFKRETLVVILSAWVFFSVLWLYGRSAAFKMWFGFRPTGGGLTGLYPYFFFVGASVLTRSVLPLATGRFLLAKAPTAFGYRWRNAMRGGWVYAALTAFIVLLIVFVASEQTAFIKKYPWCKPAIDGGTLSGWVFLVYAAAALLFFFSGESFWRGYLLFGAERELGPIALFLMVNIYVFGHFGKPLLETVGAVAAGLVLGILALKHRSFYLGVLCHWTVAMTMDLVALHKRGVHWIW